MKHEQMDIPQDKIVEFCKKWKITELALFGSVLREDFGPDSDVDVLVAFTEDAPWNLWHLIDMREELGKLLGREVDLVEKRALLNPFRKHEILRTKQVVYAA